MLSPKPTLSPTPLQKTSGLQEQQPKKTEQDTTRQGQTTHIEADQGYPVGGKESQEQTKESEGHHFPLLGVPQ